MKKVYSLLTTAGSLERLQGVEPPYFWFNAIKTAIEDSVLPVAWVHFSETGPNFVGGWCTVARSARDWFYARNRSSAVHEATLYICSLMLECLVSLVGNNALYRNGSQRTELEQYRFEDNEIPLVFLGFPDSLIETLEIILTRPPQLQVTKLVKDRDINFRDASNALYVRMFKNQPLRYLATGRSEPHLEERKLQALESSSVNLLAKLHRVYNFGNSVPLK